MDSAADFNRSFAVQRVMRGPVRTTSTITDVLRRWANGDDTAAIAAVTGMPQADICRIVAADQDRRHTMRSVRAESIVAETFRARSGRLRLP